MKNIPRKCPVCNASLTYRTLRDIECSLNSDHFYAHISSNVISFWVIEIIVDENIYSLFSEVLDKLVYVRDYSTPINYTVLDDDGIILSANIWHPYITGKVLDSSKKLVKRLLKLKAFV